MVRSFSEYTWSANKGFAGIKQRRFRIFHGTTQSWRMSPWASCSIHTSCSHLLTDNTMRNLRIIDTFWSDSANHTYAQRWTINNNKIYHRQLPFYAFHSRIPDLIRMKFPFLCVIYSHWEMDYREVTDPGQSSLIKHHFEKCSKSASLNFGDLSGYVLLQLIGQN